MRGKVYGYPPRREALLLSPIAGGQINDGVEKQAGIKGKKRRGSKEESRWKE
jgi:hypothetical protein